MPTYEYRCKDCGEHLEVVQSFTDAALTECPRCSGSLRKVFGSIGITFKGSGFYKTDSRSGSSRTAGSSSDSSSSTDGKTESTSETKGDSKTESKPTTDSKPKPKPESTSSAKSA
jgi:putative FmdB family regulatory protein